MQFEEIDRRIKALSDELTKRGLTPDTTRIILKRALLDLVEKREYALDYAIRARMTRLALSLIETDKDRDLALSLSAAYGNITLVEEFNKLGGNPRAFNREALRRAARNGSLEIVTLLMTEKDDKALNTVLYAAVEGGKLHVIDHYLDKTNSKQINTILDLAISLQKFDIVEYILKETKAVFSPETLRNILKKNRPEMLKVLLDLGLNPNTVLERGLLTTSPSSLLSLAVQYRRLEMVEMLLEYKADVTFGENQAIDYAVHQDGLELTKLLLDHGAKIKRENLEFAIEQGHFEILRLLLNNIPDSEDRAVDLLPLAIRVGKERGILLLLEYVFYRKHLDKALKETMKWSFKEEVDFAKLIKLLVKKGSVDLPDYR